MEKRYFLNNSNTKWISIGIVPAAKLISPSAPGFYAEIAICGNKMKPLYLNGLDGFLTICSAVRSLDDFKFSLPGTASPYTDANLLPLNITKRVFNGAQCYQFEMSAGSAFLAMPSVMDILKHEKMVVAAYTILASRVAETERKFNDIVTKGSLDLSALLANAEKSSDLRDLFTIELLVNFGDIIRASIENHHSSKIQGRKRTAAAPARRQATKKAAVAPVGTADEEGTPSGNNDDDEHNEETPLLDEPSQSNAVSISFHFYK